jgi:hypothetical protein
MSYEFPRFFFLVLSFAFVSVKAWAQVGNSGSIEGLVKDQSGGVIAVATVAITCTETDFTERSQPIRTRHFGSQVCHSIRTT